MNCKFCGKEVQENATFCEHCGKNLKEESKPNGCLMAILVLIVGFIVLVMLGSATPEIPIEKSITEQKTSAKYYCHEAIKKMLLNPREAEFASFTDINFTEIENMRWLVNSYVYATNPYGGVVKTDFTCKVKLVDKEHGIVEDFKLDK